MADIDFALLAVCLVVDAGVPVDEVVVGTDIAVDANIDHRVAVDSHTAVLVDLEAEATQEVPKVDPFRLRVFEFSLQLPVTWL